MRLIPMELTPFPCGYFDDRDAIYNHYYIIEAQDEERQMLLEMGYRAFGKYYFRPACQACQRCVPMRVPLGRFKSSKSQRRVMKRCGQIRVEVGTPSYSEEKYAIYYEHLQRFNIPRIEDREDLFRRSFYDPDFPALEFEYFLENKLIGVGIVHETQFALSSVYMFYRLDYADLSLGTFSALKEIEYGLQHDKLHLYLGYWIRDNHSMRYKSEFRPNEILTSEGRWEAFRDSDGDYLKPKSISFEPFPTPLDRMRS